MLFSLSSLGANPIDVQRESSLTLQYGANETAFSGLEIKTYRVAELLPDGTYELTGDFAEYPVNIYGITSKTEWDSAVAALAGYVQADQLSPTAEGTTDSDGKIVFEKLKTGMYLTLGVRHETSELITVFDAFLTSVPTPLENAAHIYDVTVFPKSTSIVPIPEQTEYKLVKIWKDEGFESRRPSSLTVEILKDGVLQSTQTLSTENNWSYRWTAPVDGSLWTVVERSVPRGYVVSMEVREQTFLLSNTYDELHRPSSEEEVSMRRKITAILLILGILLILASALWVIGSVISQSRAEENREAILTQLRSLMPEPRRGAPDGRSEPSLPRLSVEGTDFVGILEVTRFDTDLPVGASWDVDAAEKYPCCYWGNPYEGSLMIGGSDGDGQFDFMNQITEGDSVFFTDVTGLRFFYQVSEIHVSDGVSFDVLSALDADLIFFARNTYSLDYTVVCCELA